PRYATSAPPAHRTRRHSAARQTAASSPARSPASVRERGCACPAAAPALRPSTADQRGSTQSHLLHGQHARLAVPVTIASIQRQRRCTTAAHLVKLLHYVRHIGRAWTQA